MNVTAGEYNYELELPDSSLVEELKIKRHNFPHDFVFVVGSSAAQVIYYHINTNFIVFVLENIML